MSPTPATGDPRLVLLPAVDVVDGQAVRLVQGEAGSETSYGDPAEAAGVPQSRSTDRQRDHAP